MFRRRENHARWPGRIGRVSGWVLLGVLIGAAALLAPVVRSDDEADGEARTAMVRRADFDAVVSASGRVESASRTEIRCALERVGTGGGASGGASTILSMVDDGATVRKGDVLCELDASAYEELVRQQTINVQQARTAAKQADLDLEVARIELKAYKEGEMRQTDRLYRGQIALAEADLTRQDDRLRWTRRMFDKGYFPLLQVVAEEQTLKRLALTLKQSHTAFQNYLRFTVRKSLMTLESQVIGAQAAADFQAIRLNREEERLAYYQTQVDRCTIRAPNDGLVIYANRPGRTPEVYLGAPVRQRLRLFYLPDLTRMEVSALLHETVVDRIKVGMPTQVRFEALPDAVVEGVVSSVAPLPYSERKSETGSEVTYFLGRVELTTIPQGLRPGMSAELDILSARRRGVLAVPPAAVMVERGREVCYIVCPDPREGHPPRIERRPVRVGAASPGLLEIREGLDEGDEVLLHAPKVELATAGSTGASAAWND